MVVTHERLSPLDAAFLAVETPAAHMHVGWAAVFAPPRDGERPRFTELRDHIESRLPRAPRYRQRLVGVPFGLDHAVWVDDEQFEIGRHVVRSRARALSHVIDEVMSRPLDRDRPLWQICIADALEDGTVGVVGRAHHCMVDGIAAVELASLLLDPEPDPPPPEPDDWSPQPAPSRRDLLAGAVIDRARQQLELATLPARIAASPGRVARLASGIPRTARALIDSLRPAAGGTPFNEPISPLRHLAAQDRPVEDLLRVKRAFGVTLNDVVLAVSAGGVRSFLAKSDRQPIRLKAMVPVSVRDDEERYGNRISFMFIDLPCDEPDPVRRLAELHAATSERKEAGEPEAADSILRSIGYAPHTIQLALSRMVASPRAFNLVVSNIPGPRERLYMRGCELKCAYPVVPIADRHALAIGFTTVRDRACFGLYADRESLPGADRIAAEIDRSLDELLVIAASGDPEAIHPAPPVPVPG